MLRGLYAAMGHVTSHAVVLAGKRVVSTPWVMDEWNVNEYSWKCAFNFTFELVLLMLIQYSSLSKMASLLSKYVHESFYCAKCCSFLVILSELETKILLLIHRSKHKEKFTWSDRTSTSVCCQDGAGVW